LQVLHQISHINEANIPEQELNKIRHFGDQLQTHLWPFIQELSEKGELADQNAASAKIQKKWTEILEEEKA
jgi:hypothetical protein